MRKFSWRLLRCQVAAVAILLASHPIAGEPAKDFIKVVRKGRRIQTVVAQKAGEPVRHQVKAGESLRFLYGLDPSLWLDENAVFEFEVIASLDGRKKKIFTAELDPKSRDAEGAWSEGRVSLDEFAGKSVEFEFRSLRREGGASYRLNDGPKWGSVRFGSFKRKPGEYNVILISLDTLRADHLGIDGYSRDTSPTIDRLAREGVYFKDGVSQASWTRPAHISMLTGLIPSIHGVQERQFQDHGRKRVSEDVPVLPEVMQKRGYLTQGFAGSAYLSAAFGFSRGFDMYQEALDLIKGDAALSFRDAAAWIEKHRSDKFFVFIHTYEIHAPYRHRRFVTPEMSRRESTPARYDSGVRYVDDVIGTFIDRLKELGMWDSTVLVLVSDHGDELRERGYNLEHGHTLYDDLIRVPVLFYQPRLFKPRMIKGFQAQHVDLMPTIMDLAGEPLGGYHFQGRSLLPILKGGPVPSESVAVSEIMYGGGTKNHRRELKSIRYAGDGRWKFIICPTMALGHDKLDDPDRKHPRVRYWKDKVIPAHGRELYNLDRDKRELKNLIDDDSKRAAGLEARLMEILQSGVKQEPSRSDEGPMDQLREELRSLGY